MSRKDSESKEEGSLPLFGKIRLPDLGKVLKASGLIGAIVTASFFISVEVFNPRIDRSGNLYGLMQGDTLRISDLAAWGPSHGVADTSLAVAGDTRAEDRSDQLVRRLDSIRRRMEQLDSMQKDIVASKDFNPASEERSERTREVRVRLDSIQRTGQLDSVQVREQLDSQDPPVQKVKNSMVFRIISIREEMESLESRVEQGFTWVRWGIGGVLLSIVAIYAGEKFGAK
jgi:hypothetical protein